MPATGSAWPLLALILPTGRAEVASPRDESTAPASEPASIGSPSAVPVPCASMRERLAGSNPASARAARSKPRWACPLGAVRLALRPSHRTAIPSKDTEAPSLVERSATDTDASARTYPSARASKVWQRPRGEVIPAAATNADGPGTSIRLTPATSPSLHSCSCSARSAPWHATRVAEQAVSYVAHGPCSPSTKDSRLPATGWPQPVAAYTLCPSGDALSTSAKSMYVTPTKTPTLLPSSDARSCPAAWSASSAPTTKPPCRTRRAARSSVRGGAGSSHRAAGTSPITSQPAAAMRHAAGAPSTPCGSSTLMPARYVALADGMVAATGPATGAGAGWICRKRRCATPRGVPPSKMRVGKISTPVSSPSCVASLVASSESTPASISGVSSCTLWSCVNARTARTTRLRNSPSSSSARDGAATGAVSLAASAAASSGWRRRGAASVPAATGPIISHVLGPSEPLSSSPRMPSQCASPSRSGRPAAPVGRASAHTTTSGHQHGASSSRTASHSACTLGCTASPPPGPSPAAGTSTAPTVPLSPACGSSNARA
eukprot:scaffold9184_cov66-Phaeocystis_antarctica.AAC.10